MFKIRASCAGKIMGIKALGETGKSYCKMWKIEQIFNRKKEFANKYTKKGLIMEDDSIDFVAEQFGYGMLIKNEKEFENEYMKGTPDIILKDLIIDVKNSWDCFTFPFFEKELQNRDYYLQAQVYMELTGIDDYKVIYVLSDTPLPLIEKEAFFWSRDNGYGEMDKEIYDSFVAKMTYPDIKNELKIKSFDIKRNQGDIDKIKKRVTECREYIASLKD